MTNAPTDPDAAAFPLTTGRQKGYDRTSVDEFLAHARGAFEADAGSASVGATEIREIAFPLVKHGYSIAAVDAALARIEDAFAARAREQALARRGSAAWVDETRQDAQVVLDRLKRPAGRRFSRTGFLQYGYRVDEVDIVVDRISAYLESGAPVSVQQVRSVAFRMQRRGYREAQVDAVLDAVIEVMLAVG